MEQQGGQWAILPARVRYDPNIPANAKLIYAEIAAKINEEGYCYAHNRYFAERFKLKEDTVSSLIKRLADAEYIEVDLDAQRLNADKRRIYLTGKPYDFTGGIGFKSGTGKISEGVSDLNPIPLENNNIQSSPPIVPQAGDGANKPKARKRPKASSVPAWQPEIFEAFWKLYPRGEAKQRAAAAWDKLHPDMPLMQIMGASLKRQIKSPDWQAGIGIPYASTWLNGRRWEDEIKAVPAEQPSQGGYETWS